MAAVLDDLRSGLMVRLDERRSEIEEATLNRIDAVADSAVAEDPLYREGLKRAVRASIDYSLEALGASQPPPIPTELLSQTRLAARTGISLETVLRSYFAGYTQLNDFVIEEANGGGADRDERALKGLLKAQAALFDAVIEAVSEEYGRESLRPGSSEQRRADLVKRLLDGELLDPHELGYDLEAMHLGLMARGGGAREWLRQLAMARDCRVLAVQPGDGGIWAWLSWQRRTNLDLIEEIRSTRPPSLRVSVGEPGQGLAGWRLTHRQAQAAFVVAARSSAGLVRYGENALLVAAVQDVLLGVSLRRLYIEPLARARDGGDTLRETLRAYFAAARNGASTASRLKVSRQTVSKRLNAIEQRLGRPLVECGGEVELALRLEELDR